MDYRILKISPYFQNEPAGGNQTQSSSNNSMEQMSLRENLAKSILSVTVLNLVSTVLVGLS